jgi:hypothetical protein
VIVIDPKQNQSQMGMIYGDEMIRAATSLVFTTYRLERKG